MSAKENYSVEERLNELLRSLGIEQAHFAGCLSRDWEGLLASHPEIFTSLILSCPMGINAAAARAIASRLLVFAGDRGRSAAETQRAMASLPGATLITLCDYFSPPWADPMSDRREEIGPAIIDFLARIDAKRFGRAPALPKREGEIAEISYRIQGSGWPLVLFPLALAPSQWEPLLPELSARYCTITLGGPILGMVAHLEARAHSGYLEVVKHVIDVAQLRPGDALLEVGCGPGALVRWLARRTNGANRITGVDVNRYLLREAAALARKEGAERAIEFRRADAEALPFRDNDFNVTMCCTVMEEGDADRMLAELVRVTKPGGRVAVIVRSIDMPRWVNLPLTADLKAKVEAPSLLAGNVQERGCADASLYRRFRDAKLSHVIMLPHWATYSEGERLQYMHDRVVASLTPEEASEWRDAMAEARSQGTFFISEPFHCAVGTKL